MPFYVYILVPLAVLVLGLFWKMQLAGRTGANGPTQPPPAPLPRRPPPSAAPVSQSENGVRELVARNEKLEAVKLYRTLTGCGLKEAKEAIDALAGGGPLPSLRPIGTAPTTSGDADHDPEVLRLLADDQLIGAIKRYRELTGLGLKEAKDAVERLARRR